MAHNEVQPLEKGDIYFFYRPRVQEKEPEGWSDGQRFYMVLSTADRYRLLVIGHKKLPQLQASGRRQHWGFVDMVRQDPKAITDELSATEYDTKTRGQWHQPGARPAGEGVYEILRHGDHTHLVFELELPDEPGLVQEASYIISVKNPQVGGPQAAGLPGEDEVEFPTYLMDVFQGHRFANVDPPDFLDHEGTEFVLISASGDIDKELGIELDAEKETLETAELFKDLKMDKKPEPLLKGQWR
jgi:hypothetical protein